MGSQLAQNGIDVGQTRIAYQQLQQLQGKYGELALDAGLAAGGALPPPFGTAADLAALGKSIWNLDGVGALFDVIGLVSIIGDATKGTRIANRLVDLQRSISAAADGMKGVFGRTKEVAAKYWDDIAKRNRAAYEEAMKRCNDSKQCMEQAALLKGPQYANTPKDGPNGRWTSGERGDGVWTPSNGGPAIKYENGFPDYGPHSAGNVEIPMQGNTTSDFVAADKAMREQLNDPTWRRPNDHTWHHKEDGVTMQLIPRNVHATGGGASTPHMGGASLYSGSNATEF